MQMEIASTCSVCIRPGQVHLLWHIWCLILCPVPCTWPQPFLRVCSVDARPRPLSVLWDEGCWGRWTGAQGLSKAGSWIQASGAMVMVTIVTQLSMPTRICCGFHRLEPIERGNWVVVRTLPPSSEGHGMSWGCPTCVPIFLSCHFPSYPLSLRHAVLASSLG